MHEKIRSLIGDGHEVRILVLAPTSSLQWGNFALDLAAGLEESLIRHFQPPWNGSGQSATESAELELIATQSVVDEDSGATAVPPPTPAVRFSINLLPTYFDRGLLNPGPEASRLLGADGDPLNVQLGREGTIVSKINRTANSNRSVRVVGNNSLIADFFQHHFVRGDTAEGAVLDRSTIALFEPGPAQ